MVLRIRLLLYTNCSVSNVHEHRREICGDYSGEDTPVPIPNTEVKLLSADDTWRATSRESKTLPLISSIRSYGQAVKTPPFHGGNPGSIPGRITKTKAERIRALFYYSEVADRPDQLFTLWCTAGESIVMALNS